MATSSIIPPQRVVDEVCRSFGIAEHELRGTARHQQLARARRVAVWLLLDLCKMSLADVGRELLRDHSTVLYHREQAKADMMRPAWRDAVKGMAKRIKEATA